MLQGLAAAGAEGRAQFSAVSQGSRLYCCGSRPEEAPACGGGRPLPDADAAVDRLGWLDGRWVMLAVLLLRDLSDLGRVD